jgi:hypothetical protein
LAAEARPADRHARRAIVFLAGSDAVRPRSRSTRSEGSFALGGHGQPIEWAVHICRFDENSPKAARLSPAHLSPEAGRSGTCGAAMVRRSTKFETYGTRLLLSAFDKDQLLPRLGVTHKARRADERQHGLMHDCTSQRSNAANGEEPGATQEINREVVG